MTKNITILILFIALLSGGYFHYTITSNLKANLSSAINLQSALTDTVRTYKDKANNYWLEKLSLQTNLKDLNDRNIVLTNNQKELINTINTLSKEKIIMTAAIVEMQAEIDYLRNDRGIWKKDSTLQFIADTDTLKYNITVENVKPSEFNSVLSINSLVIPNKQLIAFNWNNDKRANYPVSFSIRNTNPLIRTLDISSYAIPELEKRDVKPNFWQKVGKLSTNTSGLTVVFTAGIITGILISK